MRFFSSYYSLEFIEQPEPLRSDGPWIVSPGCGPVFPAHRLLPCGVFQRIAQLVCIFPQVEGRNHDSAYLFFVCIFVRSSLLFHEVFR